MTGYDVVIVGAGAAGCVLASRLSEDPTTSVLLVEDGGPSRHPMLSVPRAFYYSLRSQRFTRRFQTSPASGVPPEWWTRGRGLGGSTTVNGLMYTRGAAADYDALKAQGLDGWGWSQVLAAYRAIEDHELGASSTRGAGGPLAVSVPRSDDGVTNAVLVGAERWGLRRVEDFNDSDGDRVAFTPATIARGRRVSAATAFLRPALERPNLTVAIRARVERVLIEGDVAVGVQVRRGDDVEEVRARREVIVAAGAIESPLLLERSGIGSREVLTDAGIDTIVDSPRVGEGLIEHRGVSMQVRFRDRLGVTERFNSRLGRAVEGVRYLATRQGPIATSGYDVVSALRSSPGLERPDVQGVWIPMAIDETSEQMGPAPYSGLLFTGYALRPTSAGSVHVASSDPAAPPKLEPHYLEHPAECAATGAILDHARSVLAGSDLADLIDHEVFPGPEVASSADVVAHARLAGGGIYHAVGSCAMGAGADSVVDVDLRVRGVSGLRVVDASVLPFHVSGNTAAPVMAMAWLAADRMTLR
ncbi:GMC family oxidoreductase [Aeromicrobium sp. CF3.5]|uniref:GMC family oxidoreductase n=1 Tax=Aeromicrobium sp. CF3.5 TaxID=3373078 RepID=UPI003EE4C75C